MSRETTHTVRDVRCAPGELSFDVEVCGIEQTIWFKTDAPVTPNADAAVTVAKRFEPESQLSSRDQ